MKTHMVDELEIQHHCFRLNFPNSVMAEYAVISVVITFTYITDSNLISKILVPCRIITINFDKVKFSVIPSLHQ